jgi:hypothetical protein
VLAVIRGKRFALVGAAALGAVVVVVGGCRKHVTQAQCDEIVGHYAELVVREELPDASAEVIAKEKAREQQEARNDDGFKNCATELEPSDHTCAMAATTPDALEACLK